MYSYISNLTQMFRNYLIISLACSHSNLVGWENKPRRLCCTLLNSMKWLVGWKRAADQTCPHPLIESSCLSLREEMSLRPWMQQQDWNVKMQLWDQEILLLKSVFPQIFIWPISWKFLKSRQILLMPLNISNRSSISYNVESVLVCLNIALCLKKLLKNTTHSNHVLPAVYLCRPERSPDVRGLVLKELGTWGH